MKPEYTIQIIKRTPLEDRGIRSVHMGMDNEEVRTMFEGRMSADAAVEILQHLHNIKEEEARKNRGGDHE